MYSQKIHLDVVIRSVEIEGTCLTSFDAHSESVVS